MLELENGQAYETTGASTFLPNMMSDLLDNEIESTQTDILHAVGREVAADLTFFTGKSLVTHSHYCLLASSIVRVDWLTTTSKASAHASTVRS